MGKGPNIELVVGRPTGSDVVRDYLEGAERAEAFLGPHFSSLSSYRAKAAEIDDRFDRSARERAVAALRVPKGGDPARLQRFVEDGGYMVTTGQQPALFGGPLYSVTKALSAVRLAEALEGELGKPVIPVFWVASEDHDWAEASHADIVGVDNEMHRIELPPPDPAVSPALHRIPLGSGLQECVDAFLACLPQTDFSEEQVRLVRGAFRPGVTLPEAFHTTLQGLLGRFGLFFTDAAELSLKDASASTLLSELDESAEFEHVLRQTAEALTVAGYGLQVPILEGGVNLFLEGPGGRERLYREGAGFRMHTSGTPVSAEEVRRRCREDARALSPNVLLRPVVESVVFPTLAYVGGPGEMAYFSQLRAYFEAHGIRMPVVFPRWSATPVEGKVRKVLDKFGLDIPDLQRPFHEIAGDIARDEIPDDVRTALGKLRGAVGQGVAELQQATRMLDPTLKGPVQHVRSQALSALDEVERKIVQAVKRESEIALAQVEKAQVHLFPYGKPAERVQSPFYFLSRYGAAFLDGLYDAFRVNLH